MLVPAERDLLEIYEYVRRDEPLSAARLLDALISAIEGLSSMPERGSIPADSRLRRDGYRYLVEHGYLIFYRVRGDEVRVHRVLRGRRAWAALVR